MITLFFANAVIALATGLIALMPNIDFTSVDLSVFTTAAAYLNYVFGSTLGYVFLIVVNLLIAYMLWTIFFWLYSKIPGVN